MWKPVREAAALEGVRFHDLRHPAATLALAAGTDAKTVQNRMGHGSASFILDGYGHAMVGAGRAVADRLDEVLGR